MGITTEASLTQHLRTYLEHIRACEASGQKMKIYAASQGLSLRSMYDAKKNALHRDSQTRQKTPPRPVSVRADQAPTAARD